MPEQVVMTVPGHSVVGGATCVPCCLVCFAFLHSTFCIHRSVCCLTPRSPLRLSQTPVLGLREGVLSQHSLSKRPQGDEHLGASLF